MYDDVTDDEEEDEEEATAEATSPDAARFNAATFPFTRRPNFLSPAERSFHGVLLKQLGPEHTVTAKVRLGDLIKCPKLPGYYTAQNKIQMKHVDFVVCYTTTMQPAFAIELDDRSHKQAKTIERDKFVDQVFKTAGLPLLRFGCRRVYTPAEVKAALADVLK